MPASDLTQSGARGIEANGPRRGCACGLARKPPALSVPTFHRRITVTLRNLAETLAFAATGGLTLGLAGVPAGFLSGSILAVAAASLAGRPMLIPMRLMRVCWC